MDLFCFCISFQGSTDSLCLGFSFRVVCIAPHWGGWQDCWLCSIRKIMSLLEERLGSFSSNPLLKIWVSWSQGFLWCNPTGYTTSTWASSSYPWDMEVKGNKCKHKAQDDHCAISNKLTLSLTQESLTSASIHETVEDWCVSLQVAYNYNYLHNYWQCHD